MALNLTNATLPFNLNRLLVNATTLANSTPEKPSKESLPPGWTTEDYNKIPAVGEALLEKLYPWVIAVILVSSLCCVFCIVHMVTTHRRRSPAKIEDGKLRGKYRSKI